MYLIKKLNREILTLFLLILLCSPQSHAAPFITKIVAFALMSNFDRQGRDGQNNIDSPWRAGGVLTLNNQAPYVFSPEQLAAIQNDKRNSPISKPIAPRIIGNITLTTDAMLVDELISEYIRNALCSDQVLHSALQQSILANDILNVGESLRYYVESTVSLPQFTFCPSDDMPLNLVFTQGISAPREANELMEHFGGPTHTSFVTTTKDCTIAMDRGKDNSFYVVRPKRGFDMDKLFMNAPLQYQEKGKNQVVIPQGITSPDILGLVDMDNGLFIPRPTNVKF